MACTPFIYHPREAWSRTSVLAEPFAKASGFCLLEPCLALSPPPFSKFQRGQSGWGHSGGHQSCCRGESDPLQACRGLAELALQDMVPQPPPSQPSGHLPPGFRHEHLAGLLLGETVPA